MQRKKIKGSLFIVSAPSGAGKTTLCQKLVASVPGLKFSVSFTTRKPRNDEENDRDYTFVSREDFRLMAEGGQFIEWASVHGEFYGTSKKRLEDLMNTGSDVILDIDTQGAMQIKKEYREGTYIFILPPSVDVLKKRLRERMTDSQEAIQKRLDAAIQEIKSYSNYDYVIINDILGDALRECESIIISRRVITEMLDPLWVEERFMQKEEQ